jgi:hypothetical protein
MNFDNVMPITEGSCLSPLLPFAKAKGNARGKHLCCCTSPPVLHAKPSVFLKGKTFSVMENGQREIYDFDLNNLK